MCYRCSFDVNSRSHLRYHKEYIHEAIGFFTDFRLEVNVQMIIMLVVLTINDFKPQDRCSRWDNKRAKQNYLNLHKKNPAKAEI